MAVEHGRGKALAERHPSSVAPTKAERYPEEMDSPQQLDPAAQANLERAAKMIYEVLLMKQHFLRCHEWLADKTFRLVELLREAESRGVLLEESLTLVDVMFWLEAIDWQSKFLSLVLNFAKEPNRKSLRPLIELYGRNRDRMKAEAEILERHARRHPVRHHSHTGVFLHHPMACRSVRDGDQAGRGRRTLDSVGTQAVNGAGDRDKTLDVTGS